VSEHRYQAEPLEALRVVALGDLTALYHRASGATHVVAAPVPEILEMLRDAPVTVSELLAAHDLVADGNAAETLAARLTELTAIGLVVQL
jgi:PqqD family protein of HPr-rel-A system